MQQIIAKSKWFLFSIVLYLVFIFVLPPNEAAKVAYNLNDQQYHILAFLVSMPVIALWLTTYYAYQRLLAYAETIKKTPEGSDYMATATGMRWIAWGFVIPALIGQVIGAFDHSRTTNDPVVMVITNYLYVIVAVVAFNYFSSASRSLAQRAKIQLDAQTTKRLVGAFVILGVVFCYVVFHELHGRSLGDAQNSYYMPSWLVVTTIVMPYLYAWFVGLLGAYELLLLARHTGGILYQQGLRLLAVGLALIIISSSGLQYMRSLAPRNGHLSLGPTIMAAYFILALCGTGSLMLATGARKLSKIEEV